VHFHLVNKPVIGISFQKWNHRWRIILKVKKLQNPH
jgi:hypothetical protein